MLTLWPGFRCGCGRGTGRFPGMGYSVRTLAALPGAARSGGPRLSGGWRSAHKLSAANGISEWVSGEPGARPLVLWKLYERWQSSDHGFAEVSGTACPPCVYTEPTAQTGPAARLRHGVLLPPPVFSFDLSTLAAPFQGEGSIASGTWRFHSPRFTVFALV